MDVTALEIGAYRLMAETGLTAREINELDMQEYARLTGRQTPAEAAIQTLDAAYPASAPQGQEQPPVPAQEPQQPPQGITDEEFLMWRAGRARGGEGVGVFGGAGSRSAEYAEGVRRHAGRGALSSANVTEAPRLTGRYVRQDDLRDTRSAAQRFTLPGNAFGI